MKDFVNYLRAMQEPRKGGSVAMAVNSLLKKFGDEKALEYEETLLDAKYEDFKNLMQEYHDGILLFDLTDKKVWSKAVNDTLGLEKFHEAGKNKYMWKDRLNITRVTCIDEKTKKEAMKMAAAGKSQEELKAKLNRKIEGSVSFADSKHEKGESAEFDKLWDKKGVVDIADENGNHKFWIVHGIVGPEPKSTREARGAITSDYQNFLEKEWIKELRNKYPVTVNDEGLKLLFK
jgi:peptidyl-prolyl cis-trans isomerase SurA